MSTDPFATDPNVLRMEKAERVNQAKNWKDQRARYASGTDLENPGPCPNCGADTIAPDGLGWCCGECGELRFYPIVGED